jgi:DNA end-binding protein Ku
MARAIWKGTITFGEVEVPVKLYSAVEDRGVRFRLLHEPDLVPVKQEMVNPETDDVVPSDRIRRGFEVERGVFVMLDDEELEGLQPAASRKIEITRFVDPSAVDHQWYDRPYYLGPDSDNAGYFALADALEESGLEGIARWVMRKRPYTGALRVREGHLAMVTLRSAEEVVPASALATPGGRSPDERELKMARQLVEALQGPFEPEQYRDEYRDRVLELVEAKAEGRALPRAKAAKRKSAGSLADALQASLKSAKKKGRAVA